jgi:hypothetical protein
MDSEIELEMELALFATAEIVPMPHMNVLAKMTVLHVDLAKSEIAPNF